MPRTCTIVLGESQYTVTELPRKHNRAWLHMISEPAKRLVDQIEGLGDLELKSWPDLKSAGERLIGDLTALIDTDRMLDLLGEYSPEIAEARELIEDDETLYDSQVVQAFVSVLGLASPFGMVTQLFQKLATGASSNQTSKN